MDKNTKGIVAVIGAVLTLGLLYVVFRKNKPNNPELDKVQEYMGANAKRKYSKESQWVESVFGDGKYKAVFYDNNRLVIFDKDNKVLYKGNYSDGGRTINLDNGKKMSSGSVWTNLNMIVTN